jgi:GNAT superfamily N-acetyltransferase
MDWMRPACPGLGVMFLPVLRPLSSHEPGCKKNQADEETMTIVEFERDSYLISTNKSKLDVNLIYDYLNNTAYWAKGRSLEVVRKTIENSLCFGVYRGGQQVGFARVITDYATFAWLCDVFILDSEQSKGLGKWLVSSIMEHPELHGVRRMMLATRDAHELYRRYGGFTPLKQPKWIMERLETSIDND